MLSNLNVEGVGNILRYSHQSIYLEREIYIERLHRLAYHCRIHEPSFSETELQSAEVENANRSFFVQDLILSTLNESDTESEAPSIEDAAVMGEETEERPVEMADTVLRLESLNLRDREEFA